MQTKTHTCYAVTTDPLHVGAGGYRLGRVDSTIVREPGTNLPKIPGSSISGVCRNYAIYALDETARAGAIECATKTESGKPAKDRNNCGFCAICRTFGYASPFDTVGNQIGRVKFFDARLLAFPVRTMLGPVWVSTPGILGYKGDISDERILVNFDLKNTGSRLNLGWLYLEAEKNDFCLPDAVCSDQIGGAMNKRLVMAPEWLFAEIVNSNLEVRTSVAIDFKTGAAKKGALFTYEAIPRAALLAFDVVIDDYRCSPDWTAEQVTKTVTGGLKLFETLGVGGMNTRGFGRLKIVGLPAAGQGGAA